MGVFCTKTRLMSLNPLLSVTPKAIIPGPGARNQNYWFHQAFLDEKDRLQKLFRYQILKKNRDKRNVQLELIGWVENQGGAFYKKNRDGTYQRMTLQEKLKKVATVLREKRKRTSVLDMPPKIDDVPFYSYFDIDCDDFSSFSCCTFDDSNVEL